MIIKRVVLLGFLCCVTSTEAPYCRDRLGYFRPGDFKISACSMCYIYLVTDNRQYLVNHPISARKFHNEPYALVLNISRSPSHETVYASYDNQTSIDTVCKTLDDVTCDRWATCCQDAWACCERQLVTSSPTMTSADEVAELYCPQTFDGWSCWDYILANTTSVHECPSFLAITGTDESASMVKKTCGANGQWFTDPATGLEHTDYDQCSTVRDTKVYRLSLILATCLNGAGVILLLPSIFVFLMYRGLRRQCRIKIHVNLFVSVLLASSLSLVWDVAVRLDRLNHSHDRSFMYSHQEFCKIMHVLQLFARGCMFFWMSCEGFFLHRLMVNAFTPHRRLHAYLMYGWGVPVVLFTLYGVLRKVVADDSACWVIPLGGGKQALLWTLVYIPTILTLLANLYFLCRLLWQLVTKMISHPKEPSGFRKALKATFVLVPLFGLHQFLLIYQPSRDHKGYDVYEVVSAIVLNSQGVIISLVFCVFNGEVQSHLKNTFKRLSRQYSDTSGINGHRSSVSRRTSISSLQNGASQSTISLNTLSDMERDRDTCVQTKF